jgi:hypothetical protein
VVNLALDANFMGQEILNPPTVEGWHTGTEWVDTGTLVERVNSSAMLIGDPKQPGVQAIIHRLRRQHPVYSPQELVDACLALAGGLEVSESTRQELTAFAATQGELRWEPGDAVSCSEQRVGELLQLALATREYQLA